MNELEERMKMLNKSRKRVVERIFNCCRELYQEATPTGDFDKMCETGEVAKPGFFNNYYIPKEKFDSIAKKHGKYLRKFDRRIYDFEVYLGGTPTTKEL